MAVKYVFQKATGAQIQTLYEHLGTLIISAENENRWLILDKNKADEMGFANDQQKRGYLTRSDEIIRSNAGRAEAFKVCRDLIGVLFDHEEVEL